MNIKKLSLICLSLLLLTLPCFAQSRLQPALLIIGASFAKGTTPFNDNLDAPLGGSSVNFGSYLSLGDALVKSWLLNGFLINEAQAGATTFDRLSCYLGETCGPAYYEGYEKQLTKALSRVAMPSSNGSSPDFNSEYVYVSLPNDCLHSDAFGVPQSIAEPCSYEELDAIGARIVAIGQQISSLGLIPVLPLFPSWESFDTELAKTYFNFSFVIDRDSFIYLRRSYERQLRQALPDALIVDTWGAGFRHIGDGLHPSPNSVKVAANRIASAILYDKFRRTFHHD